METVWREERSSGNDFGLFHVYIPKEISKVISWKTSFLIGSFSINKSFSRSYDFECYLSIYGAHRRIHSENLKNADPSSGDSMPNLRFPSPSFLSPPKILPENTSESSFPSVIGYFGETLDEHGGLMDCGSVATQTQSPIWVHFNGDGILEKLMFQGHLVPLSNVIVLEYEPSHLLRCLMNSAQTFIGIPPVLADSFNYLVSKIPKEDKLKDREFLRLIPCQKELMKSGWCIASNDTPPNDVGSSDRNYGETWVGSINENIISKSVGITQLLFKWSQLFELISGQRNWIALSNIFMFILLDAILGTVVTFYFGSALPNYSDFEGILKVVLELLLKLLDWLSGAPAGLKLNAPLNNVFHSFYSYHLHLWEGYTGLLEPLLKVLFHATIYFGYFGLTVQLAIAKDLLSLTTFHIYCLYIYATRLFNIELHTLKSLGRLFFGRKWNPLRQRIDSVSLSLSEMFLGTFGFTVALFLLPTICVYYVVFLALRLPLLLMELSLKFFIELFNSIQIVTASLVLTNSNWIAEEIYLKPIDSSDSSKGATALRYEIKTHSTSRPFYTVPNVREILRDTFSKIIESRIITQ